MGKGEQKRLILLIWAKGEATGHNFNDIIYSNGNKN